MSYIEVCPNVYGCVAIFFKENVHKIGGQYAKCNLLGLGFNVSIFSILNYASLLLMVIYEPVIKFCNTIYGTIHVPNTKQFICQCWIAYLKFSLNTPNTKQQKHPLRIWFLPFPHSMNIQPLNTTEKTLQMYNE